ncbi:MAG TPA: hypothetical protein VL156_18955 [Terriglobales bacterium]|nr:hypothetical protein [Terriglobales bacterium]
MKIGVAPGSSPEVFNLRPSIHQSWSNNHDWDDPDCFTVEVC